MTDLHLEHVRWALALHLDVDPATIAPETTLAVLGLDPFDLVLVLLRLEELTGTELPIVELEHLRTVGDLVAVVREQDDPGPAHDAPASAADGVRLPLRGDAAGRAPARIDEAVPGFLSGPLSRGERIRTSDTQTPSLVR